MGGVFHVIAFSGGGGDEIWSTRHLLLQSSCPLRFKFAETPSPSENNTVFVLKRSHLFDDI